MTLPESKLRTTLTRIWRKDTPPPADNAQTIVEEIERRYGLRLPEDFRAYVLNVAPRVQWMDEIGFTWWSADEIKNLIDECGTESLKHNPEIEREGHDFLVFADYLVWCWAYAICCSDGPNRGKVVLIGGSRDRFVADDFAAFCVLAAKDSSDLMP